MARSTDNGPPRKTGRGQERTLTAEDQRLWQAAMRDVRAMTRRPPVAPAAPAAEGAVPDGPAAAGGRAGVATLGQAPALPHPHPRSSSHSHPPNPGIDRATLLRLKRGAIPIERTLDLHGLTEAAAHAAVLRCVKAAWSDGVRLVLIITGKGGIGGEGGVLRRALPRWLATGVVAGHVLRLEPAQTRHGGGGAFYLLLRRRRTEAGQ